MVEHEFTATIRTILIQSWGENAEKILASSPLLQYLNLKTRSATRGSKARGSFASVYALLVLIEDYVAFITTEPRTYSTYEGAKFIDLFRRQRELPFGGKLQNHAMNNRVNEEFKRFFPLVEQEPILRNRTTNRYWINETLLVVSIEGRVYNIANAVITIIEHYVRAKQDAFVRFIETCERLKEVEQTSDGDVAGFIRSLLAPNVDARIFEIVSYAILKYYYHNQTIYFGIALDALTQENLKLYKTGRTNANDGGIDFVMRPLGRFFQVTETIEVRKFFLDIDKVEHYPVTFVIKSTDSAEHLMQRLREGASRLYPVVAIQERYFRAIEEIINIPLLEQYFQEAIQEGHLRAILDEIVTQSKVEFNYDLT